MGKDKKATEKITSNVIYFVSAAVTWEVALKIRD